MYRYEQTSLDLKPNLGRDVLFEPMINNYLAQLWRNWFWKTPVTGKESISVKIYWRKGRFLPSNIDYVDSLQFSCNVFKLYVEKINLSFFYLSPSMFPLRFSYKYECREGNNILWLIHYYLLLWVKGSQVLDIFKIWFSLTEKERVKV